jgi:hypothetical protein
MMLSVESVGDVKRSSFYEREWRIMVSMSCAKVNNVFLYPCQELLWSVGSCLCWTFRTRELAELEQSIGSDELEQLYTRGERKVTYGL